MDYYVSCPFDTDADKMIFYLSESGGQVTAIFGTGEHMLDVKSTNYEVIHHEDDGGKYREYVIGECVVKAVSETDMEYVFAFSGNLIETLPEIPKYADNEDLPL